LSRDKQGIFLYGLLGVMFVCWVFQLLLISGAEVLGRGNGKFLDGTHTRYLLLMMKGLTL
jgi:hypothetical protein